MPRKIRELVADLERAGFTNRGGKGSHRNFVNAVTLHAVTVPGSLGEDAKPYLEKLVRKAIKGEK